MYGAILGDIIGSPYEFDRGNKTKTFPLFSKDSEFTDDTVMTLAVAEACLDTMADFPESVHHLPEDALKAHLIQSMQTLGRRYPYAGYGMRFIGWLYEKHPQPYNSFGNGSAMRVSAAAWLFDSLDEVRRVARISAEVSHNHPEGIKGAEATASAIFLARTGKSKAEIRTYIEENFGYDLSRSCDEIRPNYYHKESCQETVPEAITAFLEGESFEDVIRTAVSLGGDCDTLTCIAGSVAEAFYGIPEELKRECRTRLPENMGIPTEQIQVLTPTRKGVTGTVNLNRLLQEALNPRVPGKREILWGERVFREGDRIMQTRNDYDVIWTKEDGTIGTGMFNGDVGRIVQIDPSGEWLAIDFDGRVATYSVEMLNEVDLAYAQTVHKAQGSEYRCVVMAAMPAAQSLMVRGVLYTALTRAREMLVVVGDDAALRAMAENDRQQRRYSGLRWRLAHSEG
jgi:ADP-ribosylglycohydrolase